jgi:hypothetical protein
MSTTKPIKTRKRQLSNQQRIIQREAAARINAMESALMFLRYLHRQIANEQDILLDRIEAIERGIESERESVS